ncbi:hypothetical protein QYE76_036937 [Lolium multiflorum]|uniref:Uncharacterized protein n=1 Tax=Lolium multiflorum TaxID=4521 RepID=A0AAD8VNJ6_LOLMU|nr:hypothetical protein QYE76_036937 [Lolium multiflorum]
MQEQVQCLFWMYFAMQPGKHDECMAMLYKICTKMVMDMHYEARVSCVRSRYAEKHNVRISKSQARNKHLDAWQYMQVVPQYVSSNKKCYVAMAKYWTSDEFKKKHEEGQIYRALMDSASHVQGSLPLEVARRREAKKTGVDPNFF